MPQQYVMSESALRELFDLPGDDRDRVLQRLRRLAESPVDHGQNVAKMHGRDGLFRMRVGAWRVFFTRGTLVEVQAVRRRQDTTYSATRGPLGSGPEGYELSGAPTAPPTSHGEAADASPADAHAYELREDEDLARGSAPAPDGSLPRRLTPTLLRSWHVPSEHHDALAGCRTVDDLCELDIDARIVEHVFDMLLPEDVDRARARPQYLVHDEEELRAWVAGEIPRLLLRLDPEQEALVRVDSGPTLVRGGAGTGKTIVALHRALALAETEPNARILFATYTRTLARYAEELLNHLRTTRGIVTEIEVATVDALARRHAAPHETIIGDGEARAVVEQLLEGEPDRGLVDLGARYLHEEFASVIDGRGVNDLAAYVRIERTGREHLLVHEERTKVWRVYTAWKARLKREGRITWGDVRRRALDRANPAYDAVLIDEAQDLTPVALRFLTALARDRSRIHVTADAGQSLYGNGFSWRGVHQELDMRGRAKVLRRDHRTTRQVHAATRDLARAMDLTLEDDTEPGSRQGPVPIVRPLGADAPYDDLAALIRAQCKEVRLPIGAAAVLAPRREQVEQVVFELNQRDLPAELGRDAPFDGPTVKVLPFQSAKGLEFPVVIVAFVDSNVTPRTLPDLPPAEQEVHRRRDARTLFVACTRAMRSLAVVHSAGGASPFLARLGSDAWRTEPKVAAD